jgi:plastocyanin
MRTFKVFAAIAVLSAAGVACSSSDNGGAIQTPPPSASACPTPVGSAVKVDANTSLKFVPQAITVKVCQPVTWKVVGSLPHTVTGQSGAVFDSGQLNQDGTYTHSFSTAGTIKYFCKIHGASMSGTITVTS